MGLIDTLGFVMRHPLNRDRPMRGVAAFARWQLASRLERAIVIDFVEDQKLIVSRGMRGATGNIYCGLHEYEDMCFALHLLRPGDLFVDVGSNVGSYTILASAAGATSIAFEPGERFADLERNVAINRAQATCRREAVGEASGFIRFTVGRDCINRVAVDGEDYIDVPVVRLDDVIEGKPTLIKVDVEGYEGSVLAGGARTFAKASAVIMELNGQTTRFGRTEPEIRSAMADLGFREVSYDPTSQTLVQPTRRGNSIFVRDEAAARVKASRRYRVRDQFV